MKKLYLIVLLVFTLAVSGFIAVAPNPFPEDPVKIIQLYPNPATSIVFFEFSRDYDKQYILQVYSFMGKKMAELPVNASTLSLTLDNNYYRGIYVFQLRDKSGQIIESGKFQVVK